MPTFDVWVEGYIATGERGTAYKQATVDAPTFKEACEIAFEGDEFYNKETNRVWGCALYDNEADARKFAG